ncbi:MAG: Mur ligase family protein [Clostridia bacterium]|nr:Mur ligase family protein [Clostridia bacterium]
MIMRKLLAIWAAKAAAVAGRMMGKKSSSTPGSIALKICPDFIRIVSKNISRGIVVVCGTNGKTTTNNLLNSALLKCGYTTVCNNLGANMISGVANAFALSCSITGKLKADYAVLEIDEASARRVFAHLTPDYMIVTNLFRDQLDRYGELDTTISLIDEAVAMAEGVKLILNGDDPLSAQFGTGREAYYYGISEKVLPQVDESKEGQFCVKCGSEQKYNYFHYSQLGDYYCENCGNKRPEIDFDATDINLSGSMKFTVNKSFNIDVNYRGFYNIYNILAVYSALSVMGISTEGFNNILADYKPQIGRMELMDLGKPVILNLAKNPAGFNQAIQTVMLDKRKKDVIIAINALENDGQDVSWLWDVDFDKLSDETLNTLTTTGMRVYDLSLRFKYAGVNIDLITDNMREAIERALKTDAEVCYVLVNYSALFSTQNIMLDIKKEQENGGEKNER